MLESLATYQALTLAICAVSNLVMVICIVRALALFARRLTRAETRIRELELGSQSQKMLP